MECLLRPGPFDRHGHLAEKQPGLGPALLQLTVHGKYHRTVGVRRGRCPCVLSAGPGASGKQGGSRIKTPLNSQSDGQWEREADSTTDHPKLTALGEI